LTADEFVIENIYHSARGEFKGSFSELERVGSQYLEHDSVKTIFGEFVRMAIFANADRYINYVHRRRTQDRFNEESLFLANRSGDPLLREEIQHLQGELSTTRDQRDETITTLEAVRKDLKQVRSELSDRESTLTKLRNGHAEKLSFESISKGIDNDREKTHVEALKILTERDDTLRQDKYKVMAHKAGILKTIGDIVKSSWMIITGITGGLLSVIALCKKYNVKLTMATGK